MKITGIISAVVLVAIMLLSLAGCNQGADFEPIELVPEGSEVIGSMKVSEAVRDYQIYCEIDGNEKAKEWFETARDEFYGSTGMNLNDISEAVMFTIPGDMESVEDMEYAGVILTGNFADRDLIANIEEKTESEFTSAKYGSYTLYTGKSDNSAVVKVSNTMLIMGTEEALKDCIDVADGAMEPVGGVVLDNYTALGDVMMRMSMIVPDNATEPFDSADEAMMFPGLDSLGDIRTLSMSGEMSTTSFTITAKAGFASSDSAAEAADAMKTILDFFGLMSQDEELAAILNRIEVTSSASAMHINYEMSLSELAEILENMESEEGFSMDSMIPGMETEDGIAIPPASSGK